MKRFALLLTSVVLGALAISPTAQAAFGLESFSLGFSNADGSPTSQAGSHPFAVTNQLSLNSSVDPRYGTVPDEQLKNVEVQLPDGLVGQPGAVPRCPSADFVNIDQSSGLPACSNDSAVGFIFVKAKYENGPTNLGSYIGVPVYNLVPPPGVVQKFGFVVVTVPITLEFTVNPLPPHNVVVHSTYIAQPLPILGSKLTVWGVPADPAHDPYRGSCFTSSIQEVEEFVPSPIPCPSSAPEKPFLTLPRACTGPLSISYFAESWPGSTAQGSAPVQGMSGCGRLGFRPTIAAQPTTKAATSPTGLDFSLDVHDEGLTNPDGLADSDIKKAVVTLPEGFSTNPSLAEGLNVCTEADLARESVNSAPGAGCPNESKVGSVEVESPLIEEPLKGSLFIAKPYENEFGSLIALYVVFRNPTLGIIVKQPLKVETDPVTGQITTVADNLPQLPFSHFNLHFREGTRSPLASPPGCGTYNASAVLTPWAGGSPITTSSAFSIISGPGAGACPTGGTPPFHPELTAGTLNNAAGRYSPFNTRITRTDSEQEITNFSIKLPPGVIGKLAGIPFCPDAAIAAAKARTGPHGGEEEINAPSCPKASEVGRSLAGAGVGPSLAYAPGKIYLAGPYNGSALSLVSITAVKVGPFDLGNVVVRFALKINPETAEVFVDATGSDPIPHIIKGIPVHLRDIRAYVNRPDFVLNPTSCERTSTASTVLGSGTNFGSSSDDVPVTVTSPFQAADCASLGFGPKLALSLKGGTKRGDTPAFKAVLTARKGDANIGRAQVTLPHSEFLEQAHIKTICTRVQYKEGKHPGEKCPPQSIYGYAKAITPLLDDPIQGPVYLRSSSHNLPDLVAALHNGQIDINLVGRIDSVGNGQIRNTFEEVPDAPVSKFTLSLQGGKKGLLVNSTDLCKRSNRAIADFTGQNGKEHVFNPVLKPQGCSKAKKKAKGKAKRSSARRVLRSGW